MIHFYGFDNIIMAWNWDKDKCQLVTLNFVLILVACCCTMKTGEVIGVTGNGCVCCTMKDLNVSV